MSDVTVTVLTDNGLSQVTSRCVVDPRFPDYYELIEKPIDLNTIEKHILHGDYETLAEFDDDVMLLFRNVEVGHSVGCLQITIFGPLGSRVWSSTSACLVLTVGIFSSQIEVTGSAVDLLYTSVSGPGTVTSHALMTLCVHFSVGHSLLHVYIHLVACKIFFKLTLHTENNCFIIIYANHCFLTFSRGTVERVLKSQSVLF